MSQSLTTQQMAAILRAEHSVPARRRHLNGYIVSIGSSLLVAIAIGLFFIAGAGWTHRRRGRRMPTSP